MTTDKEIQQAAQALFPVYQVTEWATEILRASNDGNSLDPSDLAFVQKVVNQAFVHASERERYDDLRQKVVSGAYGQSWLFGIENLTKDEQGYVAWRGKRIEHYSTPRDAIELNNLMDQAAWLATCCLSLEKLGLPVNFSAFAEMSRKVQQGEKLFPEHTPERSQGGRFLFYWVPVYEAWSGPRSQYVAVANDQALPTSTDRVIDMSGQLCEPGKEVSTGRYAKANCAVVATKEDLEQLREAIQNSVAWSCAAQPQNHREIQDVGNEQLGHLDAYLVLSRTADQPTRRQLKTGLRQDLGLPHVSPTDFFGVTKNFPDFEKWDERPEILPDQFVERARKLLAQALPLAEIPFANKEIGKRIRQRLAEPSEHPHDYMFLIQDAWPYVHSGPDQDVSDSRRALQQDFSVLLRSDLVKDSPPEATEAPAG